ncbi:MAG TPA: hypothetical protein ENN09_05850 [Planctomycetes bacterium]|nr:hypothetical protein [Planctomycetota bacterium]
MAVRRTAVVLLAALGCASSLPLYNADGSINTLNQLQLLRQNYVRMSTALAEGAPSKSIQYMNTVEQMAELLPQIEGREAWNTARSEILKNLANMQSALRIGDTFAAKDFVAGAGAGVQICFTLGPTLFTAKGGLKNPEDRIASMESRPAPAVQEQPGLPIRPPGLYDD